MNSVLSKFRKLFFFCTLSFITLNIFAQNGIQIRTNKNNFSAQDVIKKALEKFGGVEKIREINSIFIKTSGREHRSAEIQGYHPEKQTETKHEEVIVIYPSEDKFVYEHRTERHDGSERWRREIIQGDNLIRADFVSNNASSVNSPQVPTLQREYLRRIPHILLLEINDNAEKITLDKAVIYNEKSHNIVNFSIPDNKVSLKLFFDAETDFLSKFEYMTDYPGLGNTVIEYVFDNYKKYPQLGWFPTGDSIKIGGKTLREVEYKEILVNSPKAEKMFGLPPHLAEFIAPRGATLEVAEGVFITQVSYYYPMFIEFEDFILAVEAPAEYPSIESIPLFNQSGSSALTEEFIKKIKEKIPNKPIKYLVTTHFHNDHAGGARVFMKNGTTILTTPGNKDFFERIASTDYKNSTGDGENLNLELFADKKIVTDGVRMVELINVGANPHTAENIIVYLSKEKILFQGDLFYFNGDRTFPPRSETTVMPFFANWLREKGIKPSRIYGFHSRGYASMKHVEQILSENK